MTRLKTPRIGPCMTDAARFVAAHPGCTQQQVSLAIGPNGSHFFGSRAVRRAIGAGLISDGWDGKRYHLELTEKGIDLVRSWDE